MNARIATSVPLFVFLCLEGTQAQFVEISAEINLLSYSSRQTNAEATARPRTMAVRCISSTNQWRSEAAFSMNGENKWWFDGTNVYESLRVTKPVADRTLAAIKNSGGPAVAPFDESRSHITINIWPSEDGQPMGDISVNVTWLAFCSGPYLRREGRLIPLPCEMLRHCPDRYAYKDKTETFEDGFGLPKSVDLFLSRALYVSSIDGFYNSWVSNGGERYREPMKRAAAKLEEGKHMFHYRVTDTTNFLGGTFPARFEFSQEPRAFMQNGDWFTSGTGVLKAIRQTTEPETVFDPALQQTVVDWRFRDDASGADANVYTWTNAFVPQTNEPALIERFQKRIDQANRHKKAER